MAYLWLLLLAPMILLIHPTGATPTILYVKPTEDTQCPGTPCHTLEWYARNETHSNTIMSFLPGTHNLSTRFWSSGTNNLALIATSSTWNKTIVSCYFLQPWGGALFSFSSVSNLTIKGLTFSQCGYIRQVESLDFRNVINLSMFRITILNPLIWGITASNLFGNCILEEVYIEGHDWNLVYYYGIPGGIIFEYGMQPLPFSPFGQIIITQSVFQHVWNAISIYISSSHAKSTSLEVILDHLLIGQVIGTALYIEMYPEVELGHIPALVTIKKVNFLNNSYDSVGAAESLVFLLNTENVTFIDCEFIGNEGLSAIYAENSVFALSGTITFRDNAAYEGGAMKFIANSHVILSNNNDIVFENNLAMHAGGAGPTATAGM